MGDEDDNNDNDDNDNNNDVDDNMTKVGLRDGE